MFVAKKLIDSSCINYAAIAWDQVADAEKISIGV
jgi:hypothetical protein